MVGIDVGGTGIKGAPVDADKGALAADRVRLPTPRPATPTAVADTIAAVLDQLGVDGPVGCTIPGPVQHGLVHQAPNLSPSWHNLDAETLLRKRLGRPVTLLNDADAAGLAEAHFGAAQDIRGVVVLVTLGTGIGTAVVAHGQLVPNTELGHLRMGKTEAEKLASNAVRLDKGLSWKKWAGRISAYLSELERLLWPDLFIVGGGVSKKFDKFGHRLQVRAPVVPAELGNEAGIVGAALHARAAAAST